jgi:hypothetical protein
MLPRSQNDNVVGSERTLPIDPDNTPDLPKNRENRRLKIAGLVLMALPAPGFFYLANRLDPDPWQTNSKGNSSIRRRPETRNCDGRGGLEWNHRQISVGVGTR